MDPFTTNIEEAFRKLEDYTAEELTYAIRRAVNRAAYELKETTLQNLRSSGINIGQNPKYNDTLDQGVRMRKSRVKNMGEEIFSEVSILGSKATGSGTYRLRFFEKGTRDRYQKTSHGHALKKPRYVGQLKPKWFFKNANITIATQLEQIYDEEISKAIEKINNDREL